MTDIKLTDEVLAVMSDIIDESPFRAMWTTDQFIAAIRTLRDRARAVVDRYENEEMRCNDCDSYDLRDRNDTHPDTSWTIHALREVLP